MKNAKAFAALVLCGLLGSAMLYAQADRGTITGIVTDPQGAVIPDAEIQITNVNTGVATTVRTSGTGNYTTPPLIIGMYEMRLEQSGFQVFVAVGIRLDSGQTFRQDVTLQVGSVTETVEVSAVGIQINTANTEVSSAVDQKYYEDLPTVTTSEMRIPESLLYAVPAFMPLKATNTFPSGTQFMARINGGQRAGFENYLDGASYGEVSGHNQTQERSVPYESVAEMRVIENTFSAQYGHTSGGFVEYTTKSGGSKLHGQVYEYFRNDKLDARGAVAPNAPVVRKNSYGFTVGGPAYIPKVYDGRNKTFFFGNFDQLKFRQAVFQDFLTIPIDPFRRGDFSQLLGGSAGADACGTPVSVGQIFDPASGRDASTCGGPAGTLVRDPFPNNQVPIRSSVGGAVANLIPPVDRPGILSNHARESRDRFLDVRTILTRVDHNFTDLLRMAVTFNYNDRPRITNCDSVGGCSEGTRVLGNAMEQRISTKLLHIQLTHTPKPNFYTHSTFGYDRWILPSTSLEANKGWSSQIGLSGLIDADTGGFPYIEFDQRYSRFGRPFETQGQATDRWQFLNDTTWLKGRHTIKMGIEYRWERWAVFSKGNLAGRYKFSFRNTGAFDATGAPIVNTGDPFASMLLGEVSAADFDITARPIFDRDYFAPWINDDIKVTDRLTLSFGFRMDYQLGRKERHDTYSHFNPTIQNPVGIPGGIEFAGSNGTRRVFNDLDTSTYGPRVGFAYRHGENTVIRGGYGIYYAGVVMSQFLASPTFGYSSNPTVTDPSGRQAAFNWDNPFPQANIIPPPFINAGTANGQSVVWLNPNSITLPRYQNWTLSFQRQLQDNLLFDISYIGNKGTRLIASRGLADANQNNPSILGQFSPGLLSSGINSPEAQAAGFTAPYASFPGRDSVAQALRPFPQYQDVTSYNGANGTSSYHALQTKIEKRFSGGFQARFAYTWAKLINNGAEGGLSGIADARPQSVFVPENSLSVDHIPHRVTLNYSFALPFGKGRRFLGNLGGAGNAILGGWHVAGVHRYFAGRPLSIFSNNIFGGILFNGVLRPDRVAGVDGYGNTDNSNYEIVGDRYLSLGGWQNPADNRLGNASRVDPVIRGWANYNEDIAIFKDTFFTEQAKVRLGANFSNMFNRHVWCDANTNFSDLDNFGLVSGQCGEARRIELYLKIVF